MDTPLGRRLRSWRLISRLKLRVSDLLMSVRSETVGYDDAGPWAGHAHMAGEDGAAKYAPTPADGGLPQTLEFHSRLPEQARKYGDIAVAVRKPAHRNPLYGANPQVGHVELVADVPAARRTARLNGLPPYSTSLSISWLSRWALCLA